MSASDVLEKGALDADAANVARKGDLDQAYYQALLDIGKGSIDRSRAAAELVQKAAAAVATLYVGILGVSFSVSNHRLPIRGLVPAAFLSVAIILSTWYVAYLSPRERFVELRPLSTSPPERLQNRLDNFFRVIWATVQQKAPALRGSLASLGVGIALLPAPFLAVAGSDAIDPTAVWPSPPVASSDREASLEAIRYKAQVDEVALRRGQLIESAADIADWGLITLGGVVVVVLVAVAPFGILGAGEQAR